MLWLTEFEQEVPAILHPQVLPESLSSVPVLEYEHFQSGFVIATGCLHALGIAIGLIHRWPLGQKVVRAAGAGITLAGVYFLLQAVS